MPSRYSIFLLEIGAFEEMAPEEDCPVSGHIDQKLVNHF